jgi:DNA-binding transcriptional regulator YdaS (Cro superfamily)
MAALRGIDENVRALALRNHATFLKRAVVVTHAKASKLLGISPATESEWCTEYMERACQHLAALGLEVVVKGTTIPPDEARAIMALASAHMERRRIESQVQDTQPGGLDE